MSKFLKLSLFIISSFIVLYLGYHIVLRRVYSDFTDDNHRNSENYIIPNNYITLIEKIDSIKSIHTEYGYFEDGYINYDKYYRVYFYLSDIKSTCYCIIRIRKSNNQETIFSLSAVSKGINFASWKSINTEDLTNKENKEIKKKFESEILDKLGEWRKPHFWE